MNVARNILPELFEQSANTIRPCVICLSILYGKLRYNLHNISFISHYLAHEKQRAVQLVKNDENFHDFALVDGALLQYAKHIHDKSGGHIL